jgi:hypothetical protein
VTDSTPHLRVIEETVAYWTVVFDYPPFNIVDASIFEALQDLLARMDTSSGLPASRSCWTHSFISPSLRWSASRRFAAASGA